MECPQEGRADGWLCLWGLPRETEADSWRACVPCASPGPASLSPQAVLAGAVAFIYEKRGGIYWVSLGKGRGGTPGPEAGGHPSPASCPERARLSPAGLLETGPPGSHSASSPHQALLKTLLALAAFATAIAAVAIGARYFHEYKFHFRDYICQVSSTGLSWGAAARTTPSPEETRRLHLCLSYLSMLKVGGGVGGGRGAAGSGRGGPRCKSKAGSPVPHTQLDHCHRSCGTEQTGNSPRDWGCSRLVGHTNPEMIINEPALQGCTVLRRDYVHILPGSSPASGLPGHRMVARAHLCSEEDAEA